MLDADDYEILEKLRISDDYERRHVERIHILITTVIIASYFTPTLQNLISNENVRTYTDALLVISIIYLVIRLIDITIPVRELNDWLDLAFGFIAPLGFLISVLGYLFSVTVANFEITLTRLQLLVVGIGAVFISFILAIIRTRYKRQQKNIWNQIEDEISNLSEVEEYIANNPEKIQEGLIWERTSLGNDMGVDFIGSNNLNNPVGGVVKLRRVDSPLVQKIGGMLQSNQDLDRIILITNQEPTDPAKKALENYRIDLVQIDLDVQKKA